MNADCTPAVDIRGAEKCYGKKSNVKPTITALNLHVPRGNIYALLGPSGCGKTTLLRCILGRLKLDQGSVLVFGHPPGSKESGIPGPAVGYMPQETTVYLTMTIGECLWYFGTIFGISSEQTNSKTKYLIDLLNLPPKNTLTRTLSGGELRRVQFAAALMHDPKLVVLDEPTVGIDVITKQSMWEHLIKLTKENGSSIMLTTHYIEEARLADRVGMIHNCTMAAEDTTNNLLRKYRETTLEEVFLKICCGDSVEVIVDNRARTDFQEGLLANQSESEKNGHTIPALVAVETDGFAENSRKKDWTKRCNFGIAWHRLFPILMRSSIILYRFPGAMLMVFLLPSIQMFLFRETMGSHLGGMPMIIVNEDVGHLGAQYLSYLNPEIIIQKPYHNYEDGFQALWNGESYGILRIKSNFSSVFRKRFSDFAIASSEIIDAGNLQLQMDNTNLYIAKYAKFHVLEMFQDFLHDNLRSSGLNPLIAQLPINVSRETAKLLTRPISVYVISGEAVMISYFSAVSLAVLIIFMERQKGYMELNLIAGVTPLEIILGVLLFQAVVVAVQNVGVILIMLPFLNEFCKGSIFLIISLMYVQGFGGTALGIFLSLFFDRNTSVFGISAYILFAASGLSGTFWPFEAMNLYFRYMCQCLPHTFASRAIEVIVHRGWDLRYFTVYTAFGLSFLWTFIFLALSFWMFSRKKLSCPNF